MPELPTGTVTFLFTDVEGSTQLLRELGPEGYERALAEHRRIVRGACARHGGVEVDTQGDAFFVAFSSARAAIAAAEETQLAPELPVRIGIHTGEARLGAEGYAGLAVHLGARIAAAGHGGQVLLSQATRVLVNGDVAELGEHRLKDFPEPVALFQLGSERFPPLRTISNTNLPRPVSSFVGRERELREVTALLHDRARLVTLSGPGGSGKTRLAIEAAAELVPEFKAGVFWVGLAPLRDPALVMETIAQTLGAKDGLAEHIAERELLLLVDNLEHVVEAAPDLASLVEACPNLRLLVTSRELLRVRGEVEYAVPPLSEPEAVDLFCERAQVEPVNTIPELCRRLDNLPLAVELAAARARVLSPKQILERLSKRLDLLKGGRDAEARQHTLRAAIEWSYDLLDEEEQRLFRRLAVFSGGCTLEAAEDVAEADLDTLQSLVDKSLLRQSEERFWMLETIREYATERLEQSGAANEMRGKHAHHFLALVEKAPGAAASPALSANVADTATWRELVEADYANVRAALAWFRETGDLEAEFRLVFPITWLFLWVQGGMKEAGRMYEALLSRADDLRPLRRVDALQSLSHFGTYLDRDTRRQLAEQSLALARSLGDKGRIEWSLRRLALRQDDPLDGRPMLLECELLARDLPEEGRLAWIQQNLGVIALEVGEYDEARTRLQESVAIFERIGGRWQAANALSCLAAVAVLEQRYDDARWLLAETLRRALDLRMANHAAQCLDNFAAVALSRGGDAVAARLLAAASAIRDETGDETAEDDWDYERQMRAQTLATTRKRLGADFEGAWRGGGVLTLEEAVALALEEVGADG